MTFCLQANKHFMTYMALEVHSQSWFHAQAFAFNILEQQRALYLVNSLQSTMSTAVLMDIHSKDSKIDTT